MNCVKSKIESTLGLPFELIEIDKSGERFVFAFKCFDDDQSDYSIKKGGVTGKFEISYRGHGIDSGFLCDLTVGNVHQFYLDLDNAYNIQLGKHTKVTLQDYSKERSLLSFSFDKLGHCFVSGCFKNKDYGCRNGICFEEIEIDQTEIPRMLSAMKKLFNELERIQGHSDFY